MDKLIGSSFSKPSWEEWPIAAKWFPSENEGESKTKEKYLKGLTAVFIFLFI